MENTEKIYIVLSRSGTFFARLIRLLTKKYYSHASIAFDESISEFYSFGRKNPNMLFPAGFISEGIDKGYFGVYPNTKVAIIACDVTKEQSVLIKNRLEEFTSDPYRYKYATRGLPILYFNIPYHNPTRFTCSGFTAYLMQDFYDFGKDYSLVQPEDFYKLNHVKIYEGTAGEYRYEKQYV